MAEAGDEFLREGIRRWGRARSLLDAFEQKLLGELTRIGNGEASRLKMSVVRPKSRILSRDRCIRVEFTGTFATRPAELVLGVEWVGDESPEFYAGFFSPKELTSLDGPVAAHAGKLGVRIRREGTRDWAVLPANGQGLEEGFAPLLEVLWRKVEMVTS